MRNRKIQDFFFFLKSRHSDSRAQTLFFFSEFFFTLFYFIYLFQFWLCWVFVSVRGLSLVVASGGHSSSQCADLSLSRPLLLWSTGSRRAGSVVVAHGPSCSAACGIFPDQGSNPCPLHWQADSQPLHHQGSPKIFFFLSIIILPTWKHSLLSQGESFQLRTTVRRLIPLKDIF